MLRTPTDAARRTHFVDASSDHNGVTLRSFDDNDLAAVLHLYHAGVLSESVNPPDPATDVDFLRHRFLSRQQDHLWVAEAKGKVIASIGLTEDEEQIGHVRRLRCDHEWLRWNDGEVVRMLIAKAASHARLHGLLKLVIHTPVNDERAVAFLHQLGFEFARVRDRVGKHLLEFYLNIYEVPASPRVHQA